MKADRIEAIFSKTKPVCFTRFLIDVPFTAKVVYARMTVDMEIFRDIGAGAQLEHRIAEQISHDTEDNELFIGKGTADKLVGLPLRDAGKGVVQLINATDRDRYSVRTYRLLNDDIYQSTAQGFNGNAVQPEMARQAVLMTSIRSRSEEEVPQEEGICLDGAFIPASPRYENIQIGIRFTEFPDVHLSIYTIKNDKYVGSESDFWRRFKSAEEIARADGYGAWYDNIRQMRKQSRQAGIWNGVEFLARLPPQPNRKGADYHQFHFFAVGKENDRFHPKADIQLNTGVADNTPGKVPASLTDDELIVLWDKLLSSIRIREVTPSNPGISETSEMRRHGELFRNIGGQP